MNEVLTSCYNTLYFQLLTHFMYIHPSPQNIGYSDSNLPLVKLLNKHIFETIFCSLIMLEWKAYKEFSPEPSVTAWDDEPGEQVKTGLTWNTKYIQGRKEVLCHKQLYVSRG